MNETDKIQFSSPEKPTFVKDFTVFMWNILNLIFTSCIITLWCTMRLSEMNASIVVCHYILRFAHLGNQLFSPYDLFKSIGKALLKYTIQVENGQQLLQILHIMNRCIWFVRGIYYTSVIGRVRCYVTLQHGIWAPFQYKDAVLAV